MVILFFMLLASPPQGQSYPWPQDNTKRILNQVIQPPVGYKPIPLPSNSFGAWLRGLPLKEAGVRVKHFDGSIKFNQDAHVEVVDLDVGDGDLQQCADAVIRLRAEYLFSQKRHEALVFNFTSGDPASWLNWREGVRPIIQGNKVSWARKASADDSYLNFRRYLKTVFTYAGTFSLSKELKKVHDPAQIQPGDTFIQGGFPGHAVLVLDVAVNARGHRVFLLGQSYMPAQNFHVLKNPDNDKSPWYEARSSGVLTTPEWSFHFGDLKRFAHVN